MHQCVLSIAFQFSPRKITSLPVCVPCERVSAIFCAPVEYVFHTLTTYRMDSWWFPWTQTSSWISRNVAQPLSVTPKNECVWTYPVGLSGAQCTKRRQLPHAPIIQTAVSLTRWNIMCEGHSSISYYWSLIAASFSFWLTSEAGRTTGDTTAWMAGDAYHPHHPSNCVPGSLKCYLRKATHTSMMYYLLRD